MGDFKYTETLDGVIRVRLDGKFIGEIREVETGFQYWPQGLKKHADPFDVFPEVSGVKTTIEGNPCKQALLNFAMDHPMGDIATLFEVPDTAMTRSELVYAVRFATKQLNEIQGRN